MMKSKKPTKQKEWKSVIINNPTQRNIMTNFHILKVLEKLSSVNGERIPFYQKAIKDKNEKPMDTSSSYKLLKRMKEDGLVEIKKDKESGGCNLYITQEGLKCLNTLLQQTY